MINVPEIVSVCDSTGRTWNLDMPKKDGQVAYTALPDGTVLIAGRIKTPPVTFVLGEGEPPFPTVETMKKCIDGCLDYEDIDNRALSEQIIEGLWYEYKKEG